MALECGMSCIKYLLFGFNLLFALTGLIILVTGIKVEVDSHPYVNLTDGNFYRSVPVILILVGVVIFIISFFGCCGSVKENRCMIVTFSVMLLIVLAIEVGVGIAGYMKRGDLKEALVRNLNETMPDYYKPGSDAKANFDIMQTDLQCCGINSPSDWASLGLAIPNTCCTSQELVSGGGAPVACSADNPQFHHDGCLPKLVDFLKSISLTLGGLGLGVAIAQLIGVMFACCLARSIRNQYETV